MKSYLLVAALLILSLNNLFGEIKNGYEKGIPTLKISLQSLRNILWNDPHLSAAEERDVRVRIKFLVDYMAYYEVTNTLLKQFREISPDLYNEMDTLRDCKGRIVDVYVKFIPKGQAAFQGGGMTSFNQTADDLNSCNSEYGERSVSVVICMMNKGLWILAHEFGHIKYLVPNLKPYVKFYHKKYKNGPLDATLGHHPGDPSGKTAMLFERQFRQSYFQYLKHDFDRIKSPLVLINPIKKNILESLDN